MGQTSIPCTEEARDRLAKQKPDDMTWSEFLRGAAGDDVVGSPRVGEVADELASVQDAIATVEERTGRIERMLEEVTGR